MKTYSYLVDNEKEERVTVKADAVKVDEQGNLLFSSKDGSEFELVKSHYWLSVRLVG